MYHLLMWWIICEKLANRISTEKARQLYRSELRSIFQKHFLREMEIKPYLKNGAAKENRQAHLPHEQSQLSCASENATQGNVE
mgnify:CR=1 FL=1